MFQRLSGVFEVRLYPVEYTVPQLLRNSIPDPIANSSGKLLVVTGKKRAIDVRRVEHLISQIDFRQVRARRQAFAKLFHEARLSEEPGRGISFTAMLMLLAHHKLIDDEKALLCVNTPDTGLHVEADRDRLDDLLIRREKTERVTDLVNLDRVRGLLRTIYWRRRFLASRDERRRTLNAQAEGIPAIVLDPIPASPPMDDDPNPFQDIDLARSPSPPGSRIPSPEPHSTPFVRGTSPDYTAENAMLGGRGRGYGHSPTLSVSTLPRMSGLSRRSSNASMLSEEDAHNRA